MLRTRRVLPLAAATAVLCGGCGRALVTTTVRPDGAWTRRMELHGQAPQKGNQVNIAPKVEDVFGIPNSGGWTVSRATKKDEIVVTAERTFRAGEISQPGAFLKGTGGAAQVTDNVTVKPAGAGRWEYRETLRWVGDRPKDMDLSEADAAVRSALPAEAVTAQPQQVKAITSTLVLEVWRAIFGPNTPLLPELFLHPDLAERTLARRMGATIIATLRDKLGDRLTDAQRAASARQILHAFTETLQASSKAKTNSSAQPSDDSGAAAFVPLTFSLKLPGRIVTTNGETDPLTGEVYWAMYGASPAYADVTLTATCEVAPSH